MIGTPGDMLDTPPATRSQLLRRVDLTQIKHMTLLNTSTANPLVLNNAEVTVFLAVLLASRGAQKHNGTSLSAEPPAMPEARSSLQTLSCRRQETPRCAPIACVTTPSQIGQIGAESAKSG
jgi:hypothetical protein